MPHVEEINEPDQLESHRLRWSALLARTRGGSFFQSLEWLQACWRWFGEGQKLRVLIVSSGGETIGIVPLTVRRERTRIGTVRVLTYPLHDWGAYYGPIGYQPAAALTAAMLHVRGTRRDWDLLDLRWIDPETDRGRSHSAMELAGFAARQSVWDRTCIVPLPASWEEYFSGLSSKTRSNIRRAEKRLAACGAVAMERYRPLGSAHGDDDPRWNLYEECVNLARR
ncbi:MAG: cellulose biosynthesis protein, partial [Planctomycetes bacterium]|nr:cellulose biosynthesis protein [Planctomycetota bacterium]